AETNIEIVELNLGGGFGIKYISSDEPVAYGDYMSKVAKVVNSTCEQFNLNTPKILIEPGRSIIGSEGITLYKVGNVKEIPNIRTYVSIDGGMVDNPRYILYQSSYEIMCANKANEPKSQVVTIAGKCCESGDLIQEDAKLQKVEPGDTIAVLSTGAYNYSMASNYNRIPRPAAVMVKDGKARVIINRESYEDITRNDI
ncbi:MAG: diaminopimelate decarboxylase, partial [Oscillospiraceae bacterium]